MCVLPGKAAVPEMTTSTVSGGTLNPTHSLTLTFCLFIFVYVSLSICVGRWLWHMLIKYWLFICAALFLGIAIKEPVIFNIVYMLLFLIFLIIFKVFHTTQRKV